eukprot:1195749-Prorocentrum_minimum.AAC.3
MSVQVSSMSVQVSSAISLETRIASRHTARSPHSEGARHRRSGRAGSRPVHAKLRKIRLARPQAMGAIVLGCAAR